MAYTILNTNGTILLLLGDGQVDKSATSLTLIGKNYSSYGEELNNNFIKLLANSASSSGSPPRSPLTGQLWYDTTFKRLKIYDNGFKTIGAVNIATIQPTTLQTGDLWFDLTTQQLKISVSGIIYKIGPAYPYSAGDVGFTIPETTITDTNDDGKNILLLKSYGTTLGLVYRDETGNNLPFNMDNTDLSTYAPIASTSTVVSGLTIFGDLNFSGRIKDDYLSLSVDLDLISPSPDNDARAYGGSIGTATTMIQNPAISVLLNKMFPPNSSTLTSISTVMAGILPGSQARVLCRYSLDNGVSVNGYQVRVFRTVGSYSTGTWEAYYYTTATVGGSIVPINYIN